MVFLLNDCKFLSVELWNLNGTSILCAYLWDDNHLSAGEIAVDLSELLPCKMFHF